VTDHTGNDKAVSSMEGGRRSEFSRFQLWDRVSCGRAKATIVTKWYGRFKDDPAKQNIYQKRRLRVCSRYTFWNEAGALNFPRSASILVLVTILWEEVPECVAASWEQEPIAVQKQPPCIARKSPRAPFCCRKTYSRNLIGALSAPTKWK
jgi:hypothetical protein